MEDFKPLEEKEEERLLQLLLMLFQSTKNQNIKRFAKSLFGLLTQHRFTTNEDNTIKY